MQEKAGSFYEGKESEEKGIFISRVFSMLNYMPACGYMFVYKAFRLCIYEFF